MRRSLNLLTQMNARVLVPSLMTMALALGSGCQTTKAGIERSTEVIDKSGRLAEPQSQRPSTDWDKQLEQLTRGPLSEAEADLAFLLAENFINQKQLEPATQLMRSVFNSQPSLVSGIELVRLVTLGGDLTEAEQIARKLQLFYPKSPEPSLARAYIAQLKGNRDEALDILDATQKKNPKNEEVAARHIALLIEAGKKNKAKEILLKAITDMPQSPYFLLKLARLRTEEKNYKEAKNLLDKLLKISPDNIEGWTLAGFIAMQENNNTAAERYFREAYEKQPENDTLARYYITQLLKLNKFQDARRLLLRLETNLEGDEQLDPDLTFQLGYVLFQQEEFAEAKKRFMSLAEKSTDKERMYFYAAQCEERLKNNAAALTLYEKVGSENEVAKLASQRIIQLKIEDGKFEDADQRLKEFSESKSYKLDEDDFRFMAGSLARMGQFVRAQAMAESGLQRYPQSVDLQYLRGAYLEHTVSKNASILALEKLVTKHPDHVQALNHLAYTLAEANQKLEIALGLIQRAVQKEPRNAFYLDSLGWIQFKLKHYSEAEKALNAAVAIEPNEPVIHEHLGELKFAQNDWPGALKHFESAMNIFAKQPQWKLNADVEWKSSKQRVEKRIQELRKRALPTGAS